MTDKKTKLDDMETTTGKKGSTKSSDAQAKAEESSKKTELDSLSYADGRQEEEIRKARELEELVGIGEVNPYGTTLTPVFEDKLKEMTLVDMQELAVSVGVFPSGTKTSLKNKLFKAFRDYQRGSSSFVVPSASSICPEADRDSEKFKKAMELMKEGL